MYITEFLIIFIRCSCIGMDWSRKLQSPSHRETNPWPSCIIVAYTDHSALCPLAILGNYGSDLAILCFLSFPCTGFYSFFCLFAHVHNVCIMCSDLGRI